MLLGNGNGTFQSPSLFVLSTSGDTVATCVRVGDFDCDGRPDLVVGFENVENRVSVLLNTSGTTITQQPVAAVACATDAATFSVGTNWSSTYRWQRETFLGSGAFVNLSNGPTASWDGGDGGAVIYGATTPTLVITPDSSNGRQLSPAHAVRYRCVVTNGGGVCRSGTSNAARLFVNSADFNGDGDIGTDQDIEAFFACLAGTCCPTCGSADFNGDGDIGTDADIESFFRVLAGGAC